MKTGTLPVKRTISDSRRFRRGYFFLKRADRVLVVLAIASIFLAVVLVGLFSYLAIQDVSQRNKIFPGVTVAGKPVGGLTCIQATKVVREKVAGPLDQPLVVYHGDQQVKLDPHEIGVSIDVNKMAFAAFLSGRSMGAFERMGRRFMNKPIKKDIPVFLQYDSKKLKDFVAGVAENMNYRTRDASIDVSTGQPQIKPSRNGLQIKQKETMRAIAAALRNRRRKIPLVTVEIKPQVTVSNINKIVVIKQSEHTLYLYDMEYLTGTYTVAVGSPQYPTPLGKFYITAKEKNPAWKNTGAAWANNMPQYIPPGPGNPLGPYWMDLGGGVGIHATVDEASLGYSVSHGCIRMSEWSAQQVFDAVNKGTPVFILP